MFRLTSHDRFLIHQAVGLLGGEIHSQGTVSALAVMVLEQHNHVLNSFMDIDGQKNLQIVLVVFLVPPKFRYTECFLQDILAVEFSLFSSQRGEHPRT